MSKGLFLSFEGIDGCGKTTQLALLAVRLREAGREVVETVEPGGTADRTSHPRHSAGPAAPRDFALLPNCCSTFASRAQNVAEVILPALARGCIVLCDRFTDSTIVYQGAGRGLDAAAILELHRIACGELFPDLTFLLHIDAATSLERARSRNRHQASQETRMDDENSALLRRACRRDMQRWPPGNRGAFA